VTGKLFCFLPLPVETQLPVHINGSFHLTSNRRSVSFESEGLQAHSKSSQNAAWNRELLSKIVCRLYEDLILDYRPPKSSLENYWSLWPTGTSVIASLVNHQLYRSIISHDSLLIKTIDGKEPTFERFGILEVKPSYLLSHYTSYTSAKNVPICALGNSDRDQLIGTKLQYKWRYHF